MAPGDSYRAELAQAAGVLRDCFMPQGQIPARVPIWITEDGISSGTMSEAAQAETGRRQVGFARQRLAVFFSRQFVA